MKKKWLILAIVILLVVAVSAVNVYKSVDKANHTKQISYSSLLLKIRSDEIQKIELQEGSTLVKAEYVDDEDVTWYFESDVPNVEVFMDYVQERVLVTQSPEIIMREADTSFLTTISSIFTFFMFGMLIFSVYNLIKTMRNIRNKKGENNNTPVFGSLFNTDLNYMEKAVKSDITFADVAGLEEEKEELREIVDFLKNPEKYEKLGAKIPRGVLLSGSPGTGKTLLAKAVAGEAGVSYLAVSGSEFVEMYVGVGASRIRGLFKEARKNAPCIIFIDEIDALGIKREHSGNSERDQTLEQLLTELDGFADRSQIVVLAATNRPSCLDSALTRPGRFDRKIYVHLPDANGRESILKIHARGKVFEEDIDFSRIAHNTPGYSGAELANLLNEAALIAARRSHEKITRDDLDEALRKVTIGLQKAGRYVSEKERRLTAVHEAGHAVVAQFLKTQSGIKEISIIPRGGAGGYTWQDREEDRSYRSKEELKEELMVLLAGRVAESIVLGDISTGASNDIEVATRIAREMVTVYGMDSEIGSISLYNMSSSEAAVFGEETLSIAGQKIRELIKEAEQQATRIITVHRKALLDRLTEELLEKETISGEQFDNIVREVVEARKYN